jgi:hypothetical protein
MSEPCDDLNQRVRDVIEGAIGALVALGMDRAEAARLLAVQGIVRMADDAERESLHELLGYPEDEYGPDLDLPYPVAAVH